MEIRQYILTRFNLPLWSKDKKRVPTATEEWLEDRFRLFETYCLPSVKCQTEQDFKWILLFDSETPERYKARIKSIAEKFRNIKVVPVKQEHAWKWVAVFRSVILKDLSGEACKVVTTYLDNDDALHCGYMSAVRAAAGTAAAGTFLSASHGLQYFEEGGYAIRLNWKQNHFISLVEEVGDFEPSTTTLNKFELRTVMGYGSHCDAGTQQGMSMQMLNLSPAWLEVVHGRNVDNDIRWFLKQEFEEDADSLKQFAVGLNVVVEHEYVLRKHFARVVQELFVRIWKKNSKTDFAHNMPTHEIIE